MEARTLINNNSCKKSLKVWVRNRFRYYNKGRKLIKQPNRITLLVKVQVQIGKKQLREQGQ